VTAGAWIDARALHPAAVDPPVSKSDAQRRAVLAAIAGDLDLVRALDTEDSPADVRTMARGLLALAAPGPAAIDCADGGTPLRLLLGQAAIRPGRTVFTGTPRLGERAHEPLLAALERALGPAGLAITRGAPWPLTVDGAADPAPVPSFRVDPTASSQFASSLLLAAAALSRREARPWQVLLDGDPASAGYLDLTVRWLRQAGYEVARDGTVTAGLARALPPAPPDWSGAAYLLVLAWRSGGCVRVDPEAAHPDRAILGVLRGIGLRAHDTGDGLTIAGHASTGAQVDGRACPDLLPTVAALAPALPGPTILLHAGILRGKESDRLEALTDLARAAGCRVTGDAERLILDPGPVPDEIRVPVRGDHRLAMSAAALAAVTGRPVWIDDPDVVAKSFPSFWREALRLGVRLTRA
jgi:3-phosphoshikimate 1-carboxyvinyltransferase